MNKCIRFLEDESAATAIEYGLIASLISIAIIAGLNSFGDATEVLYGQIETAVVGAVKSKEE